MTKQTIQVEIENKENSTIEISGSIAWKELEGYKTKALEKIAAEIEVDGFRKGKAPIEKVEESYGAMKLLSDAAQEALSDVYPRIVLENNLRIVGSPDISITKLAEDNPLEYKITTAVFPTIELGDYQGIAKKHNKTTSEIVVEDSEVEAAIEQIRTMNAKTIPADHEHTKDCNHDADMPELNDEFVKTLGAFDSVNDFKEKLTENIRLQKEREEQAKKREALMTELIADTTVEVPAVLIESELEKMVAQMKDDVMRMGLEFEKYLEQMGKSEEDLRTEWQDDAKKRAQSELILKEIAQKESITGDTDAVNKQVEMLKEQYGAEVQEANIRLYVESIFLNEAVLAYLESQK